MIEDIWQVLEEKTPFEQESTYIEQWDLDKTATCPHDASLWFDVKKDACVENLENLFTSFSLKDIANNKNSKNKNAFDAFVKTHLQNPEYVDKYAVFVDGHFQKCGVDMIALAKEIYEKFGNVEMHIGKISSQKTIFVMDTL